MNLLENWGKVKIIDLTQNLSHLTPPWPTYEPLQIKFFASMIAGSISPAGSLWDP
jgi:kynurenine formamidase